MASDFERDSDAPLARDDSYDEPGYRHQGSYTGRPAYAPQYGMRMRQMGGYGFMQRPRLPVETRPSFTTSEFLGTLLAIVALGITAAAMDIVDARLTWILTAALVFAYVLSRGLAKAGSESHAPDPREELLHDMRTREQSEERTEEYPRAEHWQQRPYYGRGGWNPQRTSATGMWAPLETRPFFLSSEFAATLLTIVAVACTAAAMPNLGARLTWILIASLVGTYAVSRGLAKAGTHSYSVDPRDELMRRGSSGRHEAPQADGLHGGLNAAETRPFMLTSEFLATVLAIIAIAISAAAIDILNVRLTWILITAMVCGYVLSRGIAKIGVKSYAVDPRERLLQHLAEGRSQAEERRAAGR